MKAFFAGLAIFLGATPAWCQHPEVDWAAMEKQVEALRTAVLNHDIIRSQKISQQLWHVTTDEKLKQSATPAERLTKAESLRRNDSTTTLPYLAMLAYQADQLEKAQQYARETIQTPSSAYDSIHSGNIVLGLVALKRDGDVTAAKSYLLAAGKAKGSPILDKWGPNVALANALLEKGQNETVLEYFQSCKSFVTKNPKLDDWIAILKGGGAPDLSGEYMWFQ